MDYLSLVHARDLNQVTGRNGLLLLPLILLIGGVGPLVRWSHFLLAPPTDALVNAIIVKVQRLIQRLLHIDRYRMHTLVDGNFLKVYVHIDIIISFVHTSWHAAHQLAYILVQLRR